MEHQAFLVQQRPDITFENHC